MELRESIESINEKLLSMYGTNFGKSPKFRVIFSEDQYEKRLTDYSDEGFQLIFPEVRLLPKYKQWVREKYILERLIPVIGETDLVTKVSYEPLWVFQDKNGSYLPPFFEGCKFVIDNLYAIMSQTSFIKYKDKNETKEEYLARVKRVEDELFGNETEIGDALAYGSGVGFTKTIN